ncbi:hypothetical protein HPB50_010133 [Hyalomma asiaticum]|uniref:Uncharacterized protein n=1 Tax=Hyalomma asiaticum TaxID=266040 RepID=A0ACB7TLW5_HYAAI|nr:hypothetical protein HPB50_010133 [Hyalomma asiaticum]
MCGSLWLRCHFVDKQRGNSGEATKRLTALKKLLVKGRRCLINKQEQQVKIRLHWLLRDVADEDVRAALAALGKRRSQMKPQQHLRAGRTVEEKAQAVNMSKTLTGLR